MSAQRRKEVARRGGVAAHQKGTAHKWTPDEARQASLKGRRQSTLSGDSRRRAERALEPHVSPMNLDAERPSPWLESLRKNLEDLFASQKRATNPRSVDHFAV